MKQNVTETLIKRLMFGLFGCLPSLMLVQAVLPIPSTASASSKQYELII